MRKNRQVSGELGEYEADSSIMPKEPPSNISSPGPTDEGEDTAQTPPTEDLSNKRIFTTGEAAAACGLSQQTIIRCFDSGRIGGFKVPGSKFRRIPREDLIRFMRANNIPVDSIESFRKRILAVDDDPAIIEAYKTIIERAERYDFKSATSGYDAGLLTESYKPHLLLLDYRLPDIDGVAVCRKIKSLPHLSGTKILCVSGVADQSVITQLNQSGVDGFLPKPFDASSLLRMIDDLLISLVEERE
jgi:excisionase family DNA binding protein